MAQITFENLKKECIREFCYKNTRINGMAGTGAAPAMLGIAQLVELKQTGRFKNPRKLIVEIEDDCVAAIERVDLRNLKPLIDLCPDSVPKWIKSGNYVLDLTDNGWEFFKK